MLLINKILLEFNIFGIVKLFIVGKNIRIELVVIFFNESGSIIFINFCRLVRFKFSVVFFKL